MNKPSKEDLIKKWSSILGPLGVTGSQLNNLSQYDHKKTRRSGKKHKKKSNE